MRARPVSNDEIAGQLTEVLTTAGWSGFRIEGVQRLSAGTNRETFRVAIAGAAPSTDETTQSAGLILQRSRLGADPRLSSCLREGQLLDALVDPAVKAPSVVAMGDAESPIGRDFVITKAIDGETIARKVLRDPDLAQARDVGVRDCAHALAAIHRTDLDAVAGFLPEVEDSLDVQQHLWSDLQRHEPVLCYAFRWLAENRPPETGRTLVHGDFRLGNLIFDAQGLAAVLDWELAHVGDPALDLGWFCATPWRFGSPASAGGLGSRQELLDAYAAAGGQPIDLGRLLWWEVVANLRWGVICAQMGFAAPFAGSGALELAVVGRRFAEAEYDTLTAIGHADRWRRTGTLEEFAAPHRRLDSLESPGQQHGLSELVADYLASLGERVSGRDRWQLRIARNALAIAQREHALSDHIADRAANRWASLRVSGDEEWCGLIERSPLRDVDTDALWSLVADHLAVDHPGYGQASSSKGS